MNAKTKAIASAILIAITGFLAYVAQIPTDAQAGFAASLAAIFPPSWRGEAGAILKLISVAATIYSVRQASKSGPPTPPPAKPPETHTFPAFEDAARAGGVIRETLNPTAPFPPPANRPPLA